MSSNSLDDLLADGVRGRHVLVRSDLNVPLDHAGGSLRVADDGRLRASLPVLKKLSDAGARVVVLAHLGRPKGEPEEKWSLRPAVDRLRELADFRVDLAADTVGPSAHSKAAALTDGDVLVLENVRFDARETSKDAAARGRFADELVALTTSGHGTMRCAYVDDAFGAVHRKHASVYDIALRVPAYQGDLVRAEVEVLTRLTQDPERPYVVVLGGSKVSDKLAVIENLLGRADYLLIGGGMVFTFLAALGHDVGSSLLEEDQVDTVKRYLDKAAGSGCEFVLPTDIVVASKFAANAEHEIVAADSIQSCSFGSAAIGLDIGPASARDFAAYIKSARTVFWNGPMGVFEFEAFAAGTKTIADSLTKTKGLTVVGGGDSASAVRSLGFEDTQFGHISTGGGASLEFLEGKELPGLSVLDHQS